jgi:glyoxylase-like metal-dependent hydrolase (beta-lactamase superfamily II)
MKRILFCLCLAPLMLGLVACASEPVAEPEDTAAPVAEVQGPTRSIVNIAGDLYRAQNDNHFTVFLVTEEGIIVSDPINRDFAEWLKAELAERFEVPVRYVLYSHSDWDHASGGEAFADTAEFIGHENMPAALAVSTEDMPLPGNAAELDANANGEIEMAEATGNFQNNFSLYDANGDGMLSGAEVARGPLNEVYPPTDTYSGRTTITLGGKSVEMIHPGTQHSANMSVLYFPDESAVFVVDFISLRRLPFQTMAGYDLDAWLGEIADVEALGANIVIPGHGDVGTTADVAEVRQYLEELRDQVAAGIEAGSSLEQLQGSITMDAYSDWGNYEQWLPLNVEGMYNMLTS